MTKAKRSKKAARLEPADVLQTRMEYYNGLARSEMKKGELGDREKIDEYLKLAQDAAKELAPYLHGKAQAGDGDEPKKHYVMRIGDPEFQNPEEWTFYYKMIDAKFEGDNTMRDAGQALNERMLKKNSWIDNLKDTERKWFERLRNGGDPNKVH